MGLGPDKRNEDRPLSAVLRTPPVCSRRIDVTARAPRCGSAVEYSLAPELDRLLSDDFLDEAARLSHGNGLSMADAMVLATALRHDADRIYTSDSDLVAYDGPIEVVNI